MDIIDKIRAANPERSILNIDRRCLKLAEESGETCQAVLAVTSANNTKEMTWVDVREELTDTIIVAMDMLLTSFPDQEPMSYEEQSALIHKELDRKLNKWADKRSNHLRSDDAA
jgi:hypothetical protein